MKRLLTALVIAFVAVACSDGGDGASQTVLSPTPAVQITADDVRSSVLGATDMGEDWQKEANASPSTVQIGGKVGPANVKDAEADATSAFKAMEGSGYVSDSIYLLSSTELAESVMEAHRDAQDIDKWTQERVDGGGSRFTNKGKVNNLPSLGDEMYTATLDVKVTKPGTPEVTRKIEYVAYRIDRVVAFVIAQDAVVSTYVSKQEKKLTRLAG